MPNHFHFLLVPNINGCATIILGDKETHLQVLSKTIGKTLSAYTLAINKQRQRSGILFQKKTKAKLLCSIDPVFVQDPYLLRCVHYIHQNPFAAALTMSETGWEFSSAKDYAGIRNGTLCDKKMLFEISGMKLEDVCYQKAEENEIHQRLF
jgi:putative transposase